RILVKPSDGVADDIAGPALDRGIAVLVRIGFGTKARVKYAESPIEARSHAGARIQNERSDECRSLIPRFLQDVRQIRQQSGQWVSEVGDGVKLRISAGKNSSVGNRGQRGLGVCSLEYNPLPCHCIEIWCKGAVVPHKSHAVGTGGVHRDENDVWNFPPGTETCAQQS